VINLYIGNHGDRNKNSVEDFVKFLTDILKGRGIDSEVSEELRDSGINIVIDGFDNYIINKQIVKLAESPASVRFVYFLTEYIEKHFMVRSFNHFGGIFDSAILSLINLYLRQKRKDFRRASFQDYLLFFLLSPMILIFGIRYFVGNIYRYFRYDHSLSTLFHIDFRLRYLLYMHTRYLGLEAMIGYADGIAFCHDGVRKGYEEFREAVGAGTVPLGLFYQEFSSNDLPRNLQDKECYIEMTGRITQYRAGFAKKIDNCITFLGLHPFFGMTKCYSFFDVLEIKPSKRGAFSLHPPQSVRWPYSSPTRIYRALCVDKNIPVLLKNLKQHPIEDLCLVYEDQKTVLTMYELYTNKSALPGFLEARVAQYLRLAKETNDHFCIAFLELVQNQEKRKRTDVESD
jgi:hypothetical protein